MNTSLVELGVSPLKLHAVSTRSRVLHGKRKMKKVEMKQAEDTEVVMNKMVKALGVSPEQLKSFDKAQEYYRLMGLVKSKINDTHDKREIVQLLTLAPQSWMVSKVAKEFNVTKYLVRKSRNAYQQKGFLEMPRKIHVTWLI